MNFYPFGGIPAANLDGPAGFFPPSRRPGACLDLLNLPLDYLETLVHRYLPDSSLAPLRATCRQLKVHADRRISRLAVQYDSMLRHSFWRTATLPSVATLVLEMPERSPAAAAAGGGSDGPGRSAASGATGADGTVAAEVAPAALPLQPLGLLLPLQSVQVLQTAPARVTAAEAPPPPLPSLLPPVTFAGLRRHLPGIRHLVLRNVYFPPRSAVGGSNGASGGGAADAAAQPPPDYPLDLSDLCSLSVEGLWMPHRGAVWRMQGLNPFPSGLGASLARGAASLTSLSLSYVTFEGADVDVLGCLTGLQELTIKSCNNFSSEGMTVLGQLTRLTHLAYVDVFYRTGIPNEMAVLSALTRLRSANFTRCDLYAEEVAAWAAWGPSLTRLEMSSRWQMTLDAVTTLLPYLTSLEHLDLADHCLDSRMWSCISTRMPRLAAARFSWVNLPALDEEEEGGGEANEGEGGHGEVQDGDGEGHGREAEGPGGSADVTRLYGVAAAAAGGGRGGGGGAAGAGGGGQPQQDGGGVGAAEAAAADLRPILGLRSLRLDGPWEGDECDSAILPLMPRLEELRIGDNPAALAVIAQDDPGVYERLERWPATNSMMLLEAPVGSAIAPHLDGGGDGIERGCGALQVLSVPSSWLQHLLGSSLPNLQTLRVHNVRPAAAAAGAAATAVGTAAAAAAAAPPPPPHPRADALLAEARLRASWQAHNRDSGAAATAASWPQLTELDVPRDLDAAALAPLCRTVQKLRLSLSYGDGLLALAGVAGAGTDGPLPRLREVTLAGQLWSGMEPEAYHSALMLALAARGVKLVYVTRGSVMEAAGAGGCWVRSRERLHLAAQLMPEVEVLAAVGGAS